MLLSSFYASIRKVFAARADFITQVLWVPIVTLPSFRPKAGIQVRWVLPDTGSSVSVCGVKKAEMDTGVRRYDGK